MDAKHGPSTPPHSPPQRGRREYLELWITLARREWGSLVLVPADREGSTADIANALADVGQRLSYEPVTAIAVSSLEYGSALALADLQQHLGRERLRGRSSPSPHANGPDAAGATRPGAEWGEAASTPGPAVPPAGAPAEPDAARRSPEPAPSRTEALAVVPPARLIISVPPVITEPLGLAAAHEADAVVLAIRLNRSRLADVRRTVELIGRERIFGCFITR